VDVENKGDRAVVAGGDIANSTIITGDVYVDTTAAAKTATLRRQYLRHLADRIGKVNLGVLAAATGTAGEPRNPTLEQVYVDGPTPLRIVRKLQDVRVMDWWLTSGAVHESRRSALLLAPDVADGGADGDDRDELAGGAFIDRQVLEVIAPRLSESDRRRGDPSDTVGLDIWDVATAAKRLVVLGDPGSGKSSFLKYLALYLGGPSLDETRARELSTHRPWPHSNLTPVYVELRRFVQGAHYPKNGSKPTELHLWNHIAAELKDAGIEEYAASLHDDLRNGHAILLLDGLDEVPFDPFQLPARRAEIRALIDNLRNVYPDTRIIITSRPYAFKNEMVEGFAVVTLDPFEAEQRRLMVQRLYKALSVSDEKAVALNDRLDKLETGLNDRPLFITLMVTLFQRDGKLPHGKGSLYMASIDLLLDRWTIRRRMDSLPFREGVGVGKDTANGEPVNCSLTDLIGISKEDLLVKLEGLAYDVHRAAYPGSGPAEISCGVIEAHLKPLQKFPALAVIAYLNDSAGVLVSLGQNLESDVFQFAHPSFEEYLAARHIAELARAAGSYTHLRDLIMEKPQTWREVGRLLGDVLRESAGAGNAWKLIADLLDDGQAPASGGDDPGWWPLWLAAAVCEDQVLLEPVPTGFAERSVCAALRNVLVALIETPQALSPPERALCGRVLSQLGDPRPGVGLDDRGLPDVVWCDVPAGEFIYQDGEKRTLPAFRIAKYPVTFVQFQAFIDDPDGYANPKWWDGLHADGLAQQREGPHEQAFHYANHPRETVSWYEAMAFCRWLSAKRGAEILLPTHQEWEKAARGTDGRKFPWGDDFDWTKANVWADEMERTGMEQTSAVGAFPDGVSPYGALDMSGNIREFTSTEHRSGSDADVGSNDRRVLRGGSWLDAVYVARAAFPDDSNPDGRSSGSGFRVASPCRNV
jgi:hypothetical protein